MQPYDYVLVSGVENINSVYPVLQKHRDQYREIILISSRSDLDQDELHRYQINKTVLRPILRENLIEQFSTGQRQERVLEKKKQVTDKKNKTTKRKDDAMLSANKILLVEDNQVNQMVATSILKKIGYQATVVANGQEAVEILQREKFGLVLMDCHMPVMDGYEATQAIRQLPGAVANIPIVAMTADAATSDRDRCLSVGMNDHMAKPIEMSALKAMVERWII